MPGEPDPSLFDEEFVRSAAFTEPSARERAKRPGWFARRRAARAARRQAKRDRRAMVRNWRAPEYRRRSRSRTAGTVTPVLVAVAVLGAVGWKVRHHVSSPETTPVAHGAVPTLSASGATLTPKAPGLFAGSPAASYADGAAGIKPPAAARIGTFSKGDIEAAYAKTRRRLIAAGLDRKTLLGGSPDAFAHVLEPGERRYFVKNLNRHDNRRTRGWVVTFAPHTARLVGKVIKVHGHMSAHRSTLNGMHGVGVRVDYLFVYPIERPGAPGTEERLVARFTGEVFYERYGGMMHAYTHWGISATPARCDVKDGFIHPYYESSAPEKSPLTGPPLNPYDQSRPEPDDGKCHRSTGT